MVLRPASTSTEPSAAAAAPPATARLASLDAFRGFDMLLMISAGLHVNKVVAAMKQNGQWSTARQGLWERLMFHTDHVEWRGCALWDLIQPWFMFMVGVALTFSLASRRAKGQSFGRMLVHAVGRSIALIVIAIVLTSNWSTGTAWVFTNVLAQIGLGYTFLFLIAWLKPKGQLIAALAILLAYWAAFAAYPKPRADLDPASVQLPADWPRLEGFASHWEKNTNAATRFDQWFLNLFPQAEPGTRYDYNRGGYQTLNFIPSLATMIFGLLAGALLRSARTAPGKKVGLMFGCGVAGIAIGVALDRLGVCPLVKRLWTPSWAIFSAGWSFVALGAFYAVIDVAKLRAWSWPLAVVGMNSIAAYCIAQLLKPWVRESLQRHLGKDIFTRPFGAVYAPAVEAGMFLIVCWLTCWWMYRRKIFVRI
jgi:predicted acyltransferase